MMKNKNGITLIALILIIVILLLGLVVTTIIMFVTRTQNSGTIEINDSYSTESLKNKRIINKKDMVKILEKSREQDNFSYEIGGIKMVMCGKNIYCENAGYKIYIDKNTLEGCIIYGNKAMVSKSNTLEKDGLKNIVGTDSLQGSYSEQLIGWLDEFEYEFLKYETYKGFDCVVYKMKKELDKESYKEFFPQSITQWPAGLDSFDTEIIVWTDLETGLVPKMQVQTIVDGKTDGMEMDLNLKVGTYKESDYDMPNLSGYNVVNWE